MDVPVIPAASLDNNASRVSGAAEPSPKLTVQEWRYSLRRIAGKVLGKGERVNQCGYRPFARTVDIRRDTGHGGTHYAGLETCGSVWHCPVCAGRVAQRRCQEVAEIIQAHQSMGGAVYMVTLTIRHHAFQRAAELRHAVTEAWRKVQGGSVWQGMKERAGVKGTVRALEVTYGQAGWHPHMHVLICTGKELPEATEEYLRGAIFDRWAAAVRKLGYGECSRDAYRFDLCGSPDEAGVYVSKWGTASELVKGHSKMARGGGFSPWQLLKLAGEGDHTAGRLFREYAGAFKGARQLTWSMGFRANLGFGLELEDEFLAADDRYQSESVCIIPWGIYRQIVAGGAEVSVLRAAMGSGWRGVLDEIRRAKIAWDDGEQWFQRPVIAVN